MASAGHVRRPTSGAARHEHRSQLLNASWRSIMTLSSLTTDIPDTLTLKHYAGKPALSSSMYFAVAPTCLKNIPLSTCIMFQMCTFYLFLSCLHSYYHCSGQSITSSAIYSLHLANYFNCLSDSFKHVSIIFLNIYQMSILFQQEHFPLNIGDLHPSWFCLACAVAVIVSYYCRWIYIGQCFIKRLKSTFHICKLLRNMTKQLYLTLLRMRVRLGCYFPR